MKELVFCGDSAGKESSCNVGDLGSILGLGKSPGEQYGYPLQHSSILAWIIPWGRKEADTTERLSLHLQQHRWIQRYYADWEKSISKDDIWSICMTYWRSQNYNDKKIFSVCHRLEVVILNEQHMRVLGSMAFYPLIVLIITRSIQGWATLVGCRLWGRTESDTTEVT